jgi:membrane AbrB-like protein
MAVSACLTATGHALSGVPGWMTALAQLAMGVQLGTAFDRATLRRCRRFIPAALLNAWMLMVGCGICGAGLALLLGKPLSALLLGTAPGGIGEMSLTASALGVDVALVVSLQVTRLALVALLVPVVFRLVHGKRREV